MTHQEIIDRLEALGRSHSAAHKAELARIEKERESLQELCGGLGHFFRQGDWPVFGDKRRCVICAKPEA
jgi:hypothetical protein